jgi:sulfur carrier protein
VNVTVNGEPRELRESARVADAVAAVAAAAAGRGLAVAVDGEVVPRGEWDGFKLRDGQRVEVLRAVQGG